MNPITRPGGPIGMAAPQPAEQLLPMIYAELRRLAHHLMAREPTPHTLQPTALVHEAWLRVAQSTGLGWSGRNHFFMAAATAMRRILIERARKRTRRKRGGDWQRVPLEQVDVATDARPEDLLLVDEVPERFARVHPTRAELVKLRFFAGLNLNEAAAVLGISEPTAKRHWAYTRAWLYQEIERLRAAG